MDILEANKEEKMKRLAIKDEKVYIHNMAQNRIDKIGSLTNLDRQWAERPLTLIKNPQKLSEVELYRTLERVIEMPEKRLKSMLKGASGTVGT